jgi:hypothetical protein
VKIRWSIVLGVGGWAELVVATPEAEFRQWLAYVPYRWVGDLAELIWRAGRSKLPETYVVRAGINAPVLELSFSWTGAPEHRMALRIHEYPDHPCRPERAELRFSLDCTRAQLLVPLWRALRDFHSRPLTDPALITSRDYFSAGDMSELDPIIAALKQELIRPTGI